MTEILFIVFVAFLLFGTEKLPEVIRGLGKGYREFQKATDLIKEEINKVADEVKGEANKIKDEVTSVKDEIKDSTNIKDDNKKNSATL